MPTIAERLMRRAAGALARRRFDPLFADPGRAQAELLRGLLQQAAGTEWGRRYGFGEIAREPDVVAAYQARVPLHRWDDLREDMLRVLDGAADVLWPGTFREFGMTSGTVSGGTLFPITAETGARARRFMSGLLLSYLAHTGRTGLLRGRVLTVPPLSHPDPERPGVTLGAGASVAFQGGMGSFRRRFAAVPPEVGTIEDYDRKIDAVVEHAIGQDVRMAVMQPPVFLLVMDRAIERFNERHGARATTAGEVWPNLKLFVSGGTALHLYADALREKIGLPGVDFLESYGATEGNFAYQTDLADPAMQLGLDVGIFYEFVRVDELGDPSARRWTVAELEPGVDYALFVTRAGGIWSYAVHDMVRFTSVRPPKLLVVGRTREILDLSHEMVLAAEAGAALEAACRAVGARVRDYHVTSWPPGGERHPGHQWLVEFERPPDDPEDLAARLDQELCEINLRYENRRRTGVLGPAELVVVPPGTFAAWLAARRGGLDSYSKVPRLSDDRSIAEAVLRLAGR